jgi:metal-responsive CopG/Arc/MetJ family transcriptional regulator
MKNKEGFRLNNEGAATVFSIRLPDDLLEKITQEAQKRRVPRSIVVREATEIGLAKIFAGQVSNVIAH